MAQNGITLRAWDMANDEMRADWDARARDNAMHYIAFEYGEFRQNPTEFYADGAREAVEVVQPVLEKLNFDAHGRQILEIGCGIGRLFPGFKKLGFGEVWGLDVSPEMVRLASESCPVRDAHLVVGNGWDLDGFDGNQFDYCFSYVVFMHIPEREVVWNYLREVYRVLRPGGGFQLQFMRRQSTIQRLAGLLPEGFGKAAILVHERLSGILHHEPAGPRPFPGSVRTWYIAPLNPEEVRTRLVKLGFSSVEIVPDPTHPAAPSFWAIGRK